MEVETGRSAATSPKICDTCCRSNIESLSSPNGYSHVSKRLASKSCPLGDKIFKWVEKEMENRPVRIKLFRKLSSMGSVTRYLSTELGTQSVGTYALVSTQEGQILAARHGIGLAKISVGDSAAVQLGDSAAVQHGVPTFRYVTSSGSPETLSIANGWLKHCVDNHDCHKSFLLYRK